MPRAVYSNLFYLLLSMIPIIGMGQPSEMFTDLRDGQEYRIQTIKGTIWMLDNLNYRTALSLEPPGEEKEKYHLTGRYYHYLEIDSVCPSGWRLPLTEEWLGYYEHLAEIDSLETPVEFTNNKETFFIRSSASDISVGENTLDLRHAGWWEGSNYGIFPGFLSTYWTEDPPTGETLNRWKHTNGSHVHLISKVYEGKTHIHIGRDGLRTIIHSHHHHLKANQARRLRRFMVRCVKINE